MVKLVDFIDFTPLNSLRKLMRADLTDNFEFGNGISLLDDDFIRQLGQDGVEIDNLNEIEFRSDLTLGWKGQRVIIYIRDVNPYRGYIKMPKFHMATCKQLLYMWKNKKSGRYVGYQNETGIFNINIIKNNEIDEIKEEQLNVCKYCLSCLDWEDFSGANTERKKIIVNEFSIASFFEKYPKSLIMVSPKYNSDTAPLNIYPKNWDEIKKEMRKNAGYTCQNEHCKITLKGKYLKFLDTHHIDGQKNNNHENNLKVLCNPNNGFHSLKRLL